MAEQSATLGSDDLDYLPSDKILQRGKSSSLIGRERRQAR